MHAFTQRTKDQSPLPPELVFDEARQAWMYPRTPNEPEPTILVRKEDIAFERPRADAFAGLAEFVQDLESRMGLVTQATTEAIQKSVADFVEHRALLGILRINPAKAEEILQSVLKE